METSTRWRYCTYCIHYKGVVNNIKTIPWPPYSPDLSPIENIWAWIDRELAKVQISTLGQLKDVLKETWYRVPEAMCKILLSLCLEEFLVVLKQKADTQNIDWFINYAS